MPEPTRSDAGLGPEFEHVAYDHPHPCALCAQPKRGGYRSRRTFELVCGECANALTGAMAAHEDSARIRN